MADVFDKITNVANDVNDVMNDASRASRAVNRVTKPIKNAAQSRQKAQVQTAQAGQTSSPTPTASSNMGYVTPSSAAGTSYTDVLGSPTEQSGDKTFYTNTAPAGTRMIIPAALSSTGRERYLGTNAVASILNLDEKKKGAGNIVVLDADGKPSLKYYDQGPNDQILIKGTNIPANVKADGSGASVRLSEAEYEAILQSLKTKTDKVTYYKTSSESGKAEDSDNDSSTWLGRNWWKVLIGMVVVGGLAWGGVAWYKHNTRSKSSPITASTGNNNTGTGGNGGNSGNDGNTGNNGNSGNDGTGGTLAGAGHQLKDLNLPDFTDPSKPIWKVDDNTR